MLKTTTTLCICRGVLRGGRVSRFSGDASVSGVRLARLRGCLTVGIRAEGEKSVTGFSGFRRSCGRSLSGGAELCCCGVWVERVVGKRS